MKIWRMDGRGKYFAIDYTVGNDPAMRYAKIKPGKVASLEAHFLDVLSVDNGVSRDKISIYQVVRINE